MHPFLNYVVLNESHYLQAGSSSQNGIVKPGEKSGNVPGGGSGSKEGKSLPAGSERKTRRKSKLEPLIIHEMEEGGV